MAEFETEVRAERVRAGQAAARARGVRWGGSEKGRYVKVTPEQEKEILRQMKQKTPITTIASITSLSRPTVYRVLANHEVG